MREIRLEPSPDLVYVGDHTMEEGMRALEHLVNLHNRPTAIICSNDMTHGVVRDDTKRLLKSRRTYP